MASKWKDLYDIGYEYKDIRRIRANLRRVSEQDFSGYRTSQKGIYSKFIYEEDKLIDYIVNRQQETGETEKQILEDYDKTTNEFYDDTFTPEEMQQFDMYVKDINYLYGSNVVSVSDFTDFEGDLDNEYITQIMSMASKYKGYNVRRATEYLDCLTYYLETGVKTVPSGVSPSLFGAEDEL